MVEKEDGNQNSMFFLGGNKNNSSRNFLSFLLMNLNPRRESKNFTTFASILKRHHQILLHQCTRKGFYFGQWNCNYQSPPYSRYLLTKRTETFHFRTMQLKGALVQQTSLNAADSGRTFQMHGYSTVLLIVFN